MSNSWAVKQVMEIAEKLHAQSEALVQVAEKLRVDVDRLPPFSNIVDSIPTNPHPTDPPAWWVRERDEIKGITIHHTLSDSPVATARYVIDKKGRPTLPYHFWVGRTGDAALCVPLRFGMWHDHTGHNNVNISVGMAGHLHRLRPSGAQIEGTALLVRWLMHEYQIPLEQVQGHCDRYATICPGWDLKVWRDEFYQTLAGDVEPF